MIDNPYAIKIISLLAGKSYEMRFIGGCVRDSLLQRPITDLDLATTAEPEAVISILKEAEITVVPTGLQHGTITAVMNNTHFEITTLRTDLQTDGRHAVVAFSKDWETDARRRDFTINALSMDERGRIYDYCGGMDDLQNRKLRFIGSARKRIAEDYLRILRYFRFASVLDWTLEDESELQACTDLAPQLQHLSRERVQGELNKLLLGPGCLRVITIMHQRHIWSQLFLVSPDLSAFEKMLRTEQEYNDPDAFRRLLALTGWHDIAALEARIILTREMTRRLENICRLEKSPELALPGQLYYFGVQAVKDFYYLHGYAIDHAVLQEWQKPLFPLLAEDIMPISGGPGPLLGQTLKQAESFWVAQNFRPDKAELVAYCINVLVSTGA